MQRSLSSLSNIVPYLSTAIIALGVGLLSTLFSIRLQLLGNSFFIIGLSSSIFYLGIFLGCYKASTFIIKVGHIRSYSGFAATLALVSLIPGLSDNIIVWSICRFINGLCLAGLYITIESWLLNISTSTNRGKILAYYMIINYGVQSLGQLLLLFPNSNPIMPFCIVNILTILSIIPLSLAPITAPHIEEPDGMSFKKLYSISPIGTLGCFVSGLLLSSLYGLLPIYVKEITKSIDFVATIMFITIFSGMLIQYPIGILSDKMDRKKVLFLLTFILTLCSVLLIITTFFKVENILLISVLMSFIGGLAFTIYPISTSSVCDLLKPSEIVEATQGMIMYYGLGSVIGPLIVSITMNLLGAIGFFISFFIIVGFLLLFMILAFKKGKKKKMEEHQFVPVTAANTPIAAELDPRIEPITEENNIK